MFVPAVAEHGFAHSETANQAKPAWLIWEARKGTLAAESVVWQKP